MEYEYTCVPQSLLSSTREDTERTSESSPDGLEEVGNPEVRIKEIKASCQEKDMLKRLQL